MNVSEFLEAEIFPLLDIKYDLNKNQRSSFDYYLNLKT